jgi:hypothetical protein
MSNESPSGVVVVRATASVWSEIASMPQAVPLSDGVMPDRA